MTTQNTHSDDERLLFITPTKAFTSGGEAKDALRQSVLDGLRAPSDHRSLPTTLLYDEKGLQLYDDITTLAADHYYLFPAESDILRDHGPEIVNVMLAGDPAAEGPSGVVLELGAGSLRKTAHLISALSDASSTKKHEYIALDLAPQSIQGSLDSLKPLVKNDSVRLRGLVTDYESGLQWIREGGLAGNHPRPQDCHDAARGRSPPRCRQQQQGEFEGKEVVSSTLTPRPLPPFGPTPSSLPEDGERVPNPLHPDTPPRSKSPSRSDPAAPLSTIGVHRDAENPLLKPGPLVGDGPSAPERALGASQVQALRMHASPPLHLLFLGSSLGNFDRVGGTSFLRSLPLRPGSSDTLLLGMDGRNEKELVERAYNDPEGYTAKFILNGLNVAGEALGLSGKENGLVQNLDYVGRYNEDIGRHEAYFSAKNAFSISVDGERIAFAKDELINIEYSYKYSDADAHAMFDQANLRPIKRWQDPQSRYSLWLLERPGFSFPLLKHPEVADSTLVDYAHGVSLTPSSGSAPESKEHSPVRTILQDDLVSDSQSHSSEDERSTPPSKSIKTGETALTSELDSAEDEDERTKRLAGDRFGLPRGGPFGTPSLQEFSEMWKLWNEITLNMIPKGMMHQKPIDLRHMCLFYLGHIPAFQDIHLSRLLNESHTEPEFFKDIFERGIDPHVDDPTQIHPHSEVPTQIEDWPSLGSILDFRDRVRARVARLYEAIARGDEKVVKLGRKVDRVLWMTLEHEGWHAETLLYMLIQRAGTPGGTIPPSGFAKPSWLTIPQQKPFQLPTITAGRPPLDTLLRISAQTFSVGLDDSEAEDSALPLLEGSDGSNDSSDHDFGWDTEHPKRNVRIEKDVLFEKRCVSNAEYLAFVKATGRDGLPASWMETEGDIKVRSLYGPVSLSIAGNWPLVASYDELAAFAAWKGGRIPNEVELRKFMDDFMGAESSTIGFKEWTFVDPVDPVPERGVRGHNGGVWEITSSVLEAHEGYVQSLIYPGFASDFFDTKHNVVIGGSFATIPRIAQRRTVRNFYQRAYPYAWTGARVVYDA